MFNYLINRHFITIFLLIGFAMRLRQNDTSRTVQLSHFWLTISCVVILVIADCVKIWAGGDISRLSWMVTADILEYSVTPIAIMSLALVTYPVGFRPRYIWIPSVINAALMCLAFVTPYVFAYDAAYRFTGGPLVLSAVVTSVFYFVMVFRMLVQRFRHSRVDNSHMLYICTLMCIIAVCIDRFTGGVHVNEAILICSVFLYMFFRSYDTNCDPLTGLLNRIIFYSDCQRYGNSITCIATLDMNGLKQFNDSRGHAAGDAALITMADSISKVTNDHVIGYRIGGDEFVLLFIRQSEESVRATLARLKEILGTTDVTASVGFGYRRNQETVEELLKQSDQYMYKDKSFFYKNTNNDRRGRYRMTSVPSKA